ncbi:MAG: STAS/SEC14 domain-containing protein [Dehalococcoidia bacterium]|nr:STAS/SEC14 domain-containing protein [Dehalococcoidia bacterium]
MPAAWISHKGTRILYVDFRKLKPESILPLMKVSDDMVRASPTKVRYLGNIEDAVVTREVIAQLRQYTDKSIRQKFEKLAVVGVTGVKKVFFTAFVATLDKSEVQVKSFKTEEEAKEWLAE